MNFQLSKENNILERIETIVKANLFNDKFGVTELAGMLGMSRSNLHRKVIATTGESVSKLICRIKLERGKELLSDPTMSVSEIAYECGFNSVTYFSKCFKDLYGYSPRKTLHRNLLRKKNIVRFIKRKVSLTSLLGVILFFCAIIILIILLKPLDSSLRKADKSIAVLPFINDRPEDSLQYLISGSMEAIIYKLSAIGDLKVVTRYSVEPYKDRTRSIKEIANDLNVNYILTGTGLRYGNSLRLMIKLIDGKRDRYIWSEEYNIEISQIEALFEVQSEIAQAVASKIEATITPFEKQQLEYVPTTSSLAYLFFQRGRDAYLTYYDDPSNRSALQRAEELYRLAIEDDSTFILPYINLSWIYMNRQKREVEKSTAMLDSVRKYLNVIFRDGSPPIQAYTLLGHYYMAIGRLDKASDSFHRMLDLDPYNAPAYNGLASLCQIRNDFVGTVQNYHISLAYAQPDEKENIYRNLSAAFLFAGCKKQVQTYGERLLEMNGDTAAYLALLGTAEYLISNNIPLAVELLLRGYELDPSNQMILKNLGEIYLDLGQVDQSLQYLIRYNFQLQYSGQVDLYETHLIGYAYLKNGRPEMAESYFDLQLEYCEKLNNSNQNACCQRAMIAAWKGYTESALKYLREYNRLERLDVYTIRNFKYNLFFTNLETDPEYQKLRDELISKYRAEQKRVMLWLDRNGLS